MNPSSVLSSACFLRLSWMQPNTQGSTGILQERSKKHTVDGRWSMIDPWLIHDDSPYPSVGKPLSTTGLPQRQHLIRDQILGWTGCSAWEEKFWRKFSVCFFRILGIKTTRSFLQEDSKAKAWSSNKRCHTEDLKTQRLHTVDPSEFRPENDQLIIPSNGRFSLKANQKETNHDFLFFPKESFVLIFTNRLFHGFFHENTIPPHKSLQLEPGVRRDVECGLQISNDTIKTINGVQSTSKR